MLSFLLPPIIFSFPHYSLSLPHRRVSSPLWLYLSHIFCSWRSFSLLFFSLIFKIVSLTYSKFSQIHLSHKERPISPTSRSRIWTKLDQMAATFVVKCSPSPRQFELQPSLPALLTALGTLSQATSPAQKALKFHWLAYGHLNIAQPPLVQAKYSNILVSLVVFRSPYIFARLGNIVENLGIN